MTIKRNRRSSDFGLYKDLKVNRKKCVLIVCCSVIFGFTVLLTIVYLAILLSGQQQLLHNTIATNAQTIYIDPIRKPGRPFEVKVLGPPPQQFVPTTSTIPPTTKRSPTHYPQLNYYKQHQYPKNIQEIIAYMSNRPSETYQNRDESRITILTDEQLQSSTINPSYYRPRVSSDQFYPYKPADISEVNLLATNSVRFSPPAWKNFQKFKHQPIPIRNYVNISDTEFATRFPKLIHNPLFANHPSGINSPNPSIGPDVNSHVPDFSNTANFPHDPNVRPPRSGRVMATVRKPLLVNINIVPMGTNAKQYPHDRKADAMTLQLKVYPDMAFFGDEKA